MKPILNLDDLPVDVRRALGEVRAIRLLPQGMTSAVALVETDGGPRVLKRARGVLYADWLHNEYRALIALAETDLPIPTPRAFVRVENKIVPESWLAMDYLAGRPLCDALADVASSSQRAALLCAFGETLARIHATPAPASIPRPTPSWIEFMLEEAGENLEHFDVDGTPELLARVRGQFQAGQIAPLPPTLIHGDYTLDNVLVEGERVTGVIDWSGCAIGDRRHDVALATRPEDGVFEGTQRLTDLEAFFNGYGAEYDLNELQFFVDLYEFF
ncbi:MAG: aminoglycoside phosphotransferase family protein [Anaerolineae bacterium]|nr:aminoglycoside phosphotransferase family protein [Thermoflexales bacterium]MDW8407981.1 aminoglycoside phosphotransferase family protein [Anaerolineae bacterium]